MKVAEAVRLLDALRRNELFEELYGRKPPRTASSTRVAEAVAIKLDEASLPDDVAELVTPRRERRKRPLEALADLFVQVGDAGTTIEEIESTIVAECEGARVHEQLTKSRIWQLRAKRGWTIVERDGRLFGQPPAEEVSDGDDS